MKRIGKKEKIERGGKREAGETIGLTIDCFVFKNDNAKRS